MAFFWRFFEETSCWRARSPYYYRGRQCTLGKRIVRISSRTLAPVPQYFHVHAGLVWDAKTGGTNPRKTGADGGTRSLACFHLCSVYHELSNWQRKPHHYGYDSGSNQLRDRFDAGLALVPADHPGD